MTSTAAYRRKADAKIRNLLRGSREVPVDLTRLALRCDILTVHLGPLLSLGILTPVANGFEIYLRSPRRCVVNLASGEKLVDLDNRQRFTFVHELSHTFFFDSTGGQPVSRQDYPAGSRLEKACDYAAGQLLVPSTVLQEDLKEVNRLTGSLLLDLSARYRVALVPLMIRVASVWNDLGRDSGVALVESDPSHTDGRILAACGCSLGRGIPELPSGAKERKLSRWLGKHVDEVFWTQPDWTQRQTVGSSTLFLRKHGFRKTPRLFFLEIEFQDEMYEQVRDLDDQLCLALRRLV